MERIVDLSHGISMATGRSPAVAAALVAANYAESRAKEICSPEHSVAVSM
jgi:hypothetical protein